MAGRACAGAGETAGGVAAATVDPPRGKKAMADARWAATTATTAAANAQVASVGRSPATTAAKPSVMKVCSSWTCETRAMPPMACWCSR